MYRLTNICIRLINVGLKAILLFLIASILTVQELGIYGVILAVSTLSVYLLGWEIWYYYNRALTKQFNINIRKSIMVLGNQFTSYIVIYIIVLPIIIYYLLEKYSPYWFFIIIIIITLHISQELSRIYTHIEKHLLASITTLLTQSAWIVVVIYYYYNEVALDLYSLLKINAVYSLIFTFLMFTIFLFMMKIKLFYFKYFFKQISLSKIIKNIIHCTKFLLSVSCFILGIVGGRLFLENFGYIEANGVYSYFQNISSVSLILLNFGLTVIMIPKLIQNRSNPLSHILMLKDFFKKTVFYSIVIFGLISTLSYIYIEYFVGKKIFSDSILIFLSINFVYFIINLGSYYNSVLYIWHKDKHIVLSNIYSFIIILPLFTLLTVSEKPIYLVTGIFFLWALLNFFFKQKYAKKVLHDINY